MREQNSERVFELAGKLFLSRILLEKWCPLYNPERPWEDKPKSNNIAPALYYVLLLGLPRSVKLLLGNKADVNA